MAGPVLDTPRLRLRPPTPADAAAFEALLCDAEAMRHSLHPEVTPGETGLAWIAHEAEARARGDLGRLAVVLRSTGEVIGWCGLTREADWPGEGAAELGFRLRDAHRGHGYGREAAGAVLVHGFMALGLRRIVALSDPGNRASIAALEAVGMRFERLQMRPGYAHPDQLYALARPAGI